MHTSALGCHAMGRGVQLNLDIRPDYPLPGVSAVGGRMPTDDEIGALDAPELLPAGSIYRATNVAAGVATRFNMQRFTRRVWW